MAPRPRAIEWIAPGEGDHGRGLAGDERLEGDHVAAPGPDGEVAVRKLGRLLATLALAVDELHCPKGLLLWRYTELGNAPLGPSAPFLSS